jgi:hypothetical protein
MNAEPSDESGQDSDVLPLRSAYPFLEANGLQAEAQTIRSTPVRMGSYTSTLRRGMVADLLKRKGLLERFVAECWPGGRTDRGKRHIDRYLRLYARFVDQGDESGAEDEEDTNAAATSFAYEDDLRDYLSTIPADEPGPQLGVEARCRVPVYAAAGTHISQTLTSRGSSCESRHELRSADRTIAAG